MKKLLSILASLGMLTPIATTVISCGKSEDQVEDQEGNETNDVDNSYETALESFKKEVNTIINDTVKKESAKWFEEDKQDNNYKFFVYDKMKTYFNSYKPDETVNRDLSEIIQTGDNLENLFNDIAIKVGFNSIKEKVNNLKSKSEYNILTNDIDNLIEIEKKLSDTQDSKSTLAFYDVTEASGNKQKGYILSSNINFSFKVNINSKDGQSKTNYNENSALNYTITSYVGLADYIENQSKLIKWNLLKQDDNSSIISLSSIENSEDDKFITNFDKIKTKVEGMFNKSEFNNNLLTDLNKIFQEEGGLNQFKDFISFEGPTDNNSLININDLNDSNQWDYKLQANQANYSWRSNKTGWNDNNFKDGESLYNDIFLGNIKSDQSNITNYLKENISNWSSSFIEKVKNDEGFEALSQDKDKIENNLSKLVNIKFVPLSNIKLKIGAFKKDMTEFKIGYGSSVDPNDNLKQLTENSVTFKSIKANVIKGVNTFYDTFNFQKNNERIFGIKSDNSLFWNQASKISRLDELADLFSLKSNTPEIISKRNDFIASSNQSTFNFKASSNYSGSSLSSSDEGLKIATGWDLKYVDLNLQFDFLNVNFRTDAVYNGSGGKYRYPIVFIPKV
ncbi:lipoprotein [Spiroplasma turonicum]|uniref:Lipoprotein n=1 Tax=Spiroplasma turonicum TaxID=216946 RepID=A0A0K1P677_9MOLU|nr:lipoprotein [Spiroplasma turonicum]AKU79806.1 hypothetical protein STURON_00560 [Spiroplasma turonicum]ALX70824.1 hypothetical protein STURO_v1c05580 [Spiroplasma turonicum]